MNQNLFERLKRYGFSDRRAVPSLDGLRAVSIGFVIVAHLSGTPGFVDWPPLYQFGQFGVRVFFVISGFLITTILLKELDKSGRIRLGRFYFRRTMRLFPACYVLIGITVILAAYGVVHLQRGDLLFASTYTMNYHFPRGRPLGHLWSLAIEEQFYLMWPATLMLLGRSRATRFVAGLLIFAPLLRLVTQATDRSFLFWSDALASGCLLAMLRPQLIRLTWYARLLSSPLFFFVPISAVAANFVPYAKVYWLGCETIMNVGIALSLDWAMRNPGTRVGRVLNWPAVAFIGVLSYSLYLWQQPFLIYRESQAFYTAFPYNVVFAFAAATLSYLLIEAPILRLRMAIEQRWHGERSTEQKIVEPPSPPRTDVVIDPQVVVSQTAIVRRPIVPPLAADAPEPSLRVER